MSAIPPGLAVMAQLAAREVHRWRSAKGQGCWQGGHETQLWPARPSNLEPVSAWPSVLIPRFCWGSA